MHHFIRRCSRASVSRQGLSCMRLEAPAQHQLQQTRAMAHNKSSSRTTLNDSGRGIASPADRSCDHPPYNGRKTCKSRAPYPVPHTPSNGQMVHPLAAELHWRPVAGVGHDLLALSLAGLLAALVHLITAPAGGPLLHTAGIVVFWAMIYWVLRSAWLEHQYKARTRICTEMADAGSDFLHVAGIQVHSKVSISNALHSRMTAELTSVAIYNRQIAAFEHSDEQKYQSAAGQNSSSSSSGSGSGGSAYSPARPSMLAVHCYHGFGANLYSYMHVQGLLADALEAVVTAHDMPGFGFTERPINAEGYFLEFNSDLGKGVMTHEVQRFLNGLHAEHSQLASKETTGLSGAFAPIELYPSPAIMHEAAKGQTWPHSKATRSRCKDSPHMQKAEIKHANSKQGNDSSKAVLCLSTGTMGPSPPSIKPVESSALGNDLIISVKGPATTTWTKASWADPYVTPGGLQEPMPCATVGQPGDSMMAQRHAAESQHTRELFASMSSGSNVVPMSMTSSHIVSNGSIGWGGSGGSIGSRDRTDTATFDEPARMSAETAQTAVIVKKVLIGHSMGSICASLQALGQADEVAALVLVAPAIYAATCGTTEQYTLTAWDCNIALEQQSFEEYTAGLVERFQCPSSASVAHHNHEVAAAKDHLLQAPRQTAAVHTGKPASQTSTQWLSSFATAAFRTSAHALLLLTLQASMPAIFVVLRLMVRSRTAWVRALHRAYYNPAKVTHQVVDVYRLPQLVHGWERGMFMFLATRVLNTTDWTSLGTMLVDDLRAVASGANKQAASEKVDLIHKLAQLTKKHSIPILIIHGRHDRLVSYENSRSLAAMLPGCELVELRDCGHMPHEEHPELFVLLVEDFIRRHAAGSDKGRLVMPNEILASLKRCS